MGNHSSGLDPFIVTSQAPINPTFIFKRELMLYFPPIFVLGWLFGHIPIARTKRESAINSLRKAAKKMKKYERTICIFPEGTRAKDGKLQPLKSGGFYMALDAAPILITPVYIKGAFELMSKGEIVPKEKGAVFCEFQEPILVNEGMEVEDIKKLVAASLENAQGSNL